MSDGPSILDFLPQSLRTQLTMERLALMRAIVDLQRERADLLAAAEDSLAALERTGEKLSPHFGMAMARLRTAIAAARKEKP